MDRNSEIQSDEGSRLMRKVANGDTEAFACLYHKFCPILRYFFAGCDDNHTSSDDLIQEVFTRLWQRRLNFQGKSRFLNYLLGIARHTVSEQKRQSRRIAVRDSQKHTGVTGDSYDGLSQPEAEFCLHELSAALEEAITKLTAKERQALELYQSKDVLFYKASRKSGCSQDALRSRLKRARKRLQELLPPALENE